MFYLGIDIAKHKHYASIIDQTGKPITKPFPFQNHKEGGQTLLNQIYQYIESPTEILIGMEATGHYWLAVYSFLLSLRVIWCHPFLSFLFIKFLLTSHSWSF